MFDYSYIIFESAAFLAAIIQINKIKHTPYIYFVPYLLYALLYEVANFYNLFSVNHSNLWVTNINMTIAFLFYSFVLCAVIKTPVFKRWIKRTIYLSIVCLAIDMAFFQGFWKLDSVMILFQYLIIISINCIYFYELMNFSEKELAIVKIPAFWLNTGLLFYCLLQFLVFSSFALAYKGGYEYRFLFDVILVIAGATLYSFIIVSLICFSKTTK